MVMSDLQAVGTDRCGRPRLMSPGKDGHQRRRHEGSNARHSLVGIRRQSAQSDKGLAKLLQKAAPDYPLARVTK
jgi:hypothetical protein